MFYVSEDAAVSRINRRLSGYAVRRCPYSSKWFGELGRYYLVDPETRVILDKHLDLVELGNQLGALNANQVIEGC